MVKNNSKEFNFDDVQDEEYTGEFYRQEMRDLRVEKINQRVIIISILIPCLIGVVLYIAYRDLTGRVTKSEFMGSKEVQALSEELENKFTELATQNSTFQASLNEKIASIEKSTNGLNDTLNKLNDSVQKLKQDVNKTQTSLKTISASKVDKKEQAAAIKKIDSTLVPMRKDIEALAPVGRDLSSLSSEIKAFDKKFKSELASVSASIEKTNNDLKQIQSELASLEDQQLDKADLGLEMLKVKINYEKAIDLAVADIKAELESLLARSKQLENNLKQLEATPTKVPIAKPPPQAKSPDSGDIKEQDIKE